MAAVLAAALAAGFLASCANPLQWQPYSSELDSLTPSDWASDLAFIESQLRAKDPHFTEDPAMAAAFSAEVGRINDSLGSESAGELGSLEGAELADRCIAAFARLLALAGEGHTALNAYSSSSFPCALRWFPAGAGNEAKLLGLDPAFARIGDAAAWGLAEDQLARALGARVLGIVMPDGGLSAFSGDGGDGEAILDAMSSAEAGIPAEVRASALRAMRPERLRDPRQLGGAGLAGIDATAGLRTLTLRLDDGAEFDLAIRETAGEAANWRVAPRASAPLASSSSEPRWHARIDNSGRQSAEGRILYLSYASCDAEAMGFFGGVLAELEAGRYDRLIVDLRQNEGGLSTPGTWFAARLGAIPSLRAGCRIHVLIGPATFSSAMWLSVDLMQKTAARFAGAAIAESPDSYGEVGRFALPSSGLVIGHSTRHHRYAEGKNLRLRDGVVAPDEGLEAEQSYADWAAGRDVVLEAAIADGAGL
jgi:hypothetical protein